MNDHNVVSSKRSPASPVTKTAEAPERLARLGFIDTRRTGNPVRSKIRSRGVPPALADREIFYTEDVREAARLIGQALAPARLAVSGNDVGFAATMNGVRLRTVSMLYLDLHVAASLEFPAMGNFYAVFMPMNGRVLCRHHDPDVEDREFEANTIRALVTSPGSALTMRLDDDTPLLLFRIEEQAMLEYLVRMRGRKLTKPLTFSPEFDLTTDVAVRWHAAVQLVHTEVFHKGSLLQGGYGISGLEDLLMNSLLLTQPSTYHDEFIRPSEKPVRPVVQAAMDYIDRNLGEAITMESIARNVHMSVRSIQQAFREELGVSPMTYVRDRRLERVHQELSDALPSDGVTVTDVAHRWGFHHLGSFASEYRKRWGTTPSETLRS